MGTWRLHHSRALLEPVWQVCRGRCYFTPALAEGIIIEIPASQLLPFVADSSGVCVHVGTGRLSVHLRVTSCSRRGGGAGHHIRARTLCLFLNTVYSPTSNSRAASDLTPDVLKPVSSIQSPISPQRELLIEEFPASRVSLLTSEPAESFFFLTHSRKTPRPNSAYPRGFDWAVGAEEFLKIPVAAAVVVVYTSINAPASVI